MEFYLVGPLEQASTRSNQAPKETLFKDFSLTNSASYQLNVLTKPHAPGTYELYARFNKVDAPKPFPQSLKVISQWANSA